MGMLIKRGRVWWTNVYDNGRQLRESTGIVSDGDVRRRRPARPEATRKRERVVMTVTGRRTRSVFYGYHIVSPADLQDVARRLAEMGTPGR